jgi:hypothetical protein
MSFGHAIHLVPNDSEEVEYNTAVGMQQMHPGKLAAHLKGADYKRALPVPRGGWGHVRHPAAFALHPGGC